MSDIKNYSFFYYFMADGPGVTARGVIYPV